MKHSHLTTPRELAGCTFAYDADPIERPIDRDDRIVLVGCVIAAVFFLGLAAGGVL